MSYKGNSTVTLFLFLAGLCPTVVLPSAILLFVSRTLALCPRPCAPDAILLCLRFCVWADGVFQSFLGMIPV